MYIGQIPPMKGQFENPILVFGDSHILCQKYSHYISYILNWDVLLFFLLFLYVRHFLQYLLLFRNITSRNVRKRNLDWCSPNSPKIIVIIGNCFDFYKNLITLDFWNFYVFYFYNFSRILIMLTIYSCLHISIKNNMK